MHGFVLRLCLEVKFALLVFQRLVELILLLLVLLLHRLQSLVVLQYELFLLLLELVLHVSDLICLLPNLQFEIRQLLVHLYIHKLALKFTDFLALLA